MQYIVIVGSLFDGFKFYGTFENSVAAVEWVEEHVTIDTEHWVIPLYKAT